MIERLGNISGPRPRRTLAVLLGFIVLAAVVGGPVAGRLQSDGGFQPGASESSRAGQQLQRATGEATSAGGVPLLLGRGTRDGRPRPRAVAGPLPGGARLARAAPTPPRAGPGTALLRRAVR